LKDWLSSEIVEQISIQKSAMPHIDITLKVQKSRKYFQIHLLWCLLKVNVSSYPIWYMAPVITFQFEVFTSVSCHYESSSKDKRTLVKVVDYLPQ
jgi:hypothetical protein